MQTELEEKNKLIAKLRGKLKYFTSEVSDLKYENERDREEFTNAIRDMYKENKLMHGMLRIMLSEGEIKRITELSKWSDENDEWKVQPFSFKDKTLKLPTLKNHQINDFIENEHASRELVINNEDVFNQTRTNKFYGNRESFKNPNKLRYDDNNANSDYYTQPVNLNNRPSGINDFKKSYNNSSNMPSLVLKQKEFKKYEDMIKPATTVISNSDQNQLRKATKIILDPIGTKSTGDMRESRKNFYNPNKKMEVSFKATLEFSNDISGKNIQIHPNINVHNQNIVNVNGGGKRRLEDIPEGRQNNKYYDNEEY
jgi:hypothetical protein